MADRIKELEEDITELKKLLLDSERPRVQEILAKHISTFKTEIDALSATTAKQ